MNNKTFDSARNRDAQTARFWDDTTDTITLLRAEEHAWLSWRKSRREASWLR